MKTIERSIDIEASKEKVWEVLFQDKYNRQWYKAFHEDAHAVTDWQLGSKVVFADNDGNGLVGKVAQRDLYKAMVIEYSAELINGKEITENMEGGNEKYFLSEKGNRTHLDVSAAGNMPDEFVDMMARSWDVAIVKIKELAESN